MHVRKVLHVVGARPNFMKVAPLMRALARYSGAPRQLLVHTGQHYDRLLSDVFITELALPAPDVNLGVGSGSHAQQTAQVMERFEPVLLRDRADLVVVVGDVNSTLAAALVCAKLGVRLVHVEAGLRSFDRKMPEEINRILTDHLADLLLTSEPGAEANLLREGIPRDRIAFVGNLMIDTLVHLLPQTRSRPVVDELGTGAGRYVLVTLHRPSNVDDRAVLSEIVAALAEVARSVRVLFAVHPRTAGNLRAFGIVDRLAGVTVLEPLGYLDFLALQRGAAAVLTDSGGIQEETTYLGVPCLTLRPNTERPITLSHGTNQLVGHQKDELLDAVLRAVSGGTKNSPPPPLWDGHAAERAADRILALG